MLRRNRNVNGGAGARSEGIRRGFTLIEMLLASIVTAITAAAASTLIFAIANAASDTRDYRTKRAEGHYALNRIGHRIRTARGIGQVTPTTVTLWEQDANEDDTVNLYEVGIIRYDASNKRIVYEKRQAMGSPPGTVVDNDAFYDESAMSALLEGADKTTVVWADNVEGLTFSGYPEFSDTRVIHTSFSIVEEGEALPFQKSASPRAPGDYIFVSEAMIPAEPPVYRVRRKHVSRWDGFGDVADVLPWDLLGG